MRRLALGLPTALQVRNGYAVLFHEGGTPSFLKIDGDPCYAMDLKPDGRSSRIRALIDSNQFVFDPALIFLRGPFFVIEAVPHC